MGSRLKYPTYNIGSWGGNWLDDNGVEWYVEGSEIRDGRSPKTHTQERPAGAGAWRSRSYLSGHTFTVAGWGRASGLAAREAARDGFLGLFVDGEQQLLTYDSGAWVRTMRVELNGQPRWAVRRNKSSFNFQLPLLATDGRMLSAVPKTTSPVQVNSLPTDGLDWVTGGGLDWSTGGGLNWGTSNAGGVLQLNNDGNVETWPVFTIVGPVVQPSLTEPATGRQLYYSGTLLAGQTLTIDTSPFTRSVMLDGTDRFGFMLSAQWMSVPPKKSGGQLLLQYGGSGTGTALATWYDAYI